MTENNQKNQTPAFQINAQYIKDLSFEAPEMPFALLDLKSIPEVNIGIDLKAAKTQNENLYTLDLTLRMNAKQKETNKSLFLCELVYGTLATVNVPEEAREAVLMVEIPHLVFPYARAIISNLIREAGLPSLQISPIDFAGLYQTKLAEKKKA
ncbi:MAG: protein-export chaperone SecB [Alphaproteobacteria bacterium]|nr:protein-export chaperone SecB [Alphaproteobacteria bacterium]